MAMETASQVHPAAGPTGAEQSVAIAVQDATDFLRATMTLAIGAFGAGTAQFLATGDQRYFAVIDTNRKSIELAVEALTRILDIAARVSSRRDAETEGGRNGRR